MSSVKHQIKAWEHQFQRTHNRPPSKQDVKLDPKIYKLYKTYRSAKTERQEPLANKIEININVTEAQSDQEIDSSDENAQVRTLNGELGPTPQANGKVLSIFDFHPTPPDSSPLKPKATNNNDTPIFKTPTKAKPIDGGIPDLKSSSLAEKLLSIANSKTPTKQPPTFSLKGLETPQYLARNNKKYEFAIESESPSKAFKSPFEKKSPIGVSNSPFIKSPSKVSLSAFTPVKLPGDTHILQKFTNASPFNNSPVKSIKAKGSPLKSSSIIPSPFHNSPSKTPVKQSTIDFLVSPSPLKPHRFLSKKLSDVFNDFKSIQEEENHYLEGEIEEEIEEEQNNEPEGPRKKKKFTQKRTTRRWKIKPRITEVGEDGFKGKNVHEEIEKINKDDQDQLAAYIDSENEESDISDENEEYTKKEPQNTKGMIKPISMNYQRLKINDPRAKAFKRRMGR